MDKSDIISIFKSKGILGPKGKRKYCWEKYWDEESEQLFENYSIKYRNNEEAWFCLLHNIEPPICPICGNLCTFTGRLKSKNKGYNTVCNNCSANSLYDKRNTVSETKKSYSKDKLNSIIIKRKQTNLERYGDENHMCYGSESFHNNMIKKYGDPYYSNREKAKQTNLERYGCEYNFQIPGYQEYIITLKKEKYGNSSNYIKTKQTNLERYGYEHIGQVKKFQIQSSMSKNAHIKKIENTYNCTHQQKLVKKYGQGWKSIGLEKIKIDGYIFIDNSHIELIERYSKEGTHTNQYVSKKEKDVVKYIKSIYDGEVLENITNIIANNNHRYYELDIYIPSLKLAFDFNGTYWHSNRFKDKLYHQRKTKACYEQGVQLIHIYEYLWDTEREEIKKMIKSIINDQFTGSLYNSPIITEYEEYELSEPEQIIIKYNNQEFTIYNEGKFIRK